MQAIDKKLSKGNILEAREAKNENKVASWHDPGRA